MAFNPSPGLVYLPARQGSFALHVPDKGWISNTNNWNRGEDVTYRGPLLAKLMAVPPMTGLLISWDPARQQQVWRGACFPPVNGGGVPRPAARLFSSPPDRARRVVRAPPPHH